MKHPRETTRLPLSLRLRAWRRGWVYLFWLLLIPAAFALLPEDRTANRANGVVEARTQTAGPSETGQIAEICVVPGQRVEKGDLLVLFHAPQTELDLADREVRLAEQRIDARRREQNLQVLLVRARQALQDAETALAETGMEHIREEAELHGLREELQRQTALTAQGLTPSGDLAKIRPQVAALEEIAAHYPALIAALTARKAQAQKEIAEIQTWIAREKEASLTEAAQMESLMHTAADQLKEGPVRTLRAVEAGTVSRIRHQVGDIVPSGEPVLRISTEGPTQVVGMFLAHQLIGIARGTRLHVSPYHRERRTRYEAEVTLIEPEFLDLADPFNPVPRYPVRGRRVHIRVFDSAALVPGESVAIILPSPPLPQRIAAAWNRLKDRFTR